MRSSSRKDSKAGLAMAFLALAGALAAYQFTTNASPTSKRPTGVSQSAAGEPTDAEDGTATEPLAPIIDPNTDTTALAGEETMSSSEANLETSRQVEHADTASFETRVLESELPVLVDFHADWCGPCQMLAPTLEELAQETAGAKIVKVNVDDNPELAASYRVSSIPTLLVFKGGQPTVRHVGLASKDQLQALLRG